MDQRSVRVVVGRGDPSRTDIRALLEDGGFTVAAEASTVEDLARLVQADPPDVVVLDDTISVAAAEAVAELAPDTKLIVIWPAAVLPIAGATRIDAAELHTTLAPAVAMAAGVLLSGFTTIDRPDWIDAVRKDPATLRDKLAAGGELPVRPSVTELQRPHGYPVRTTGWRRRSSRQAALAAAAAATAATPVGSTPEEHATANRRIGMIALGGAVAAGALMIALSFGQAQPTIVTAEPFVPGVTAGSNYIPNPASGDTTGGGTPSTTPGGTPGGTQGGTTGPVVAPVGDTTGGSGSTPGGTSGGPIVGPGTTGGGTSGGSAGGGTAGGSAGGVKTGDRQPGKSGSSQGVPGAKGGDQGPGSTTSGAPGHSGDHNPHDGPPSHSGDHNPHGGPPGQTGEHPGNGAHHSSQTHGRPHRHKR